MQLKKIFNIKTIFLIIIIFLLALNFTNYKKYKAEKENKEIDQVYIKESIETEYSKDKKYYKTINYNNYKSLLSKKDLFVLAVEDNKSNTHDKFLELINKLSFYKNMKINLLEVSKLSKKNLISFYDLDERLRKLESDYIIVIKDKKIVSIIEFDKENINKIIEGIK